MSLIKLLTSRSYTACSAVSCHAWDETHSPFHFCGPCWQHFHIDTMFLANMIDILKYITSKHIKTIHEIQYSFIFFYINISAFQFCHNFCVQSRYQNFRFQTKWSVLNYSTHCCRVERSCRMLTTSSKRCQTSTPLHCCCSMVRQLVTWLRANGRRLRGYFRRHSTRWGGAVDFLS